MRVASHTIQRASLRTAIVAILPAWEDEVRELALGEIPRVGMELVAPIVWQWRRDWRLSGLGWGSTSGVDLVVEVLLAGLEFVFDECIEVVRDVCAVVAESVESFACGGDDVSDAVGVVGEVVFDRFLVIVPFACKIGVRVALCRD